MKRKNKIVRLGGLIMKLLILFIFGWPFFWMISTSLKTIEEVNSIVPTIFPEIPQFVNYIEAWTSGPGGSMWIYLKNSLIVVCSVIFIQMIVMIPASYAFAKYNFRGKGIFFGCILIALMMPTQITFLPIYLMMSDWGLINSLLPQILPFVTNAFGIFLLRQYFMQIEDELIDAARIDGAGDLRVIIQIMLPMAKPALASIFLFSFVGQWNEYFWPLVMTNADKFRTLPVAIAQLKEMEGMANWQVIMAGNAILVLPVIIVYLFASKQIMKSFTYSGIK
ncbi:MAG: carbohydrate ABC transporter permease [Blautia sp.]